MAGLRSQYAFNLGVQFENLLKLARRGGAVYCLLSRTHVGGFDTTCAAQQLESSDRQMQVDRAEERRRESGRQRPPRVLQKTTLKCEGDVTRCKCCRCFVRISEGALPDSEREIEKSKSGTFFFFFF